jgi:hypothetical protein
VSGPHNIAVVEAKDQLAMMPEAGVALTLRLGQRVRHGDYKGKRITGVVHGLSIDNDHTLRAQLVLDAPIVIPAGNGFAQIDIYRQDVAAHEVSPFDERDELVAEMLAALKGVVRVADRATVEFDAARAVIAKAEGTA